MNAICFRSFLMVAFSILPSVIFAQTATDAFDVRISIVAECEIVSSQDLDFGETGVLSAATLAQSEISVTCTTSTPFQIGLNAGAGSGATVANRLMTGPGGATIAYQLFRNAGRTLNWGNTLTSDVLAGTGTGSAEEFTVYGQVLAQASPAPGDYSDTITVTVTY